MSSSSRLVYCWGRSPDEASVWRFVVEAKMKRQYKNLNEILENVLKQKNCFLALTF